MKHEESNLQLKFCKWVKKMYPNDLFIRHEREQQRSKFMGNLMKVYNSEIDMPDFELLERSEEGKLSIPFDVFPVSSFKYSGLYIEFKAPSVNVLMKDGQTIKKEYLRQHKAHLQLWERGRPAYFCNDFDKACEIFLAYKAGTPLPMQKYSLPLDKNAEQADEFFKEYDIKSTHV